MLALEVNRVVSTERLIDGLWGPEAPASAPKMVQLYISQLRKLLRGSDADIVTQGRGYSLRCAPGDVDAAELERLLDGVDGHARNALELWRGPPLVDVADEPVAGPEVRRFDDRRLRAQELPIDADTAAGRHEAALPELTSLVAERPLRQQVQGQLM